MILYQSLKKEESLLSLDIHRYFSKRLSLPHPQCFLNSGPSIATNYAGLHMTMDFLGCGIWANWEQLVTLSLSTCIRIIWGRQVKMAGSSPKAVVVKLGYMSELSEETVQKHWCLSSAQVNGIRASGARAWAQVSVVVFFHKNRTQSLFRVTI